MFIPLRAVFILLMMLCIIMNFIWFTGEECWGVGFYLNYAQEDCWMFLSVDPEACAKNNFQFASIDMYIKTCFTRTYTLHTIHARYLKNFLTHTHDYNNLKKNPLHFMMWFYSRNIENETSVYLFFSKPCILNCSMQNLIVPVVKCKCGLNCINCFYKIILAWE